MMQSFKGKAKSKKKEVIKINAKKFMADADKYF
jgi:hypothetical protein